MLDAIRAAKMNAVQAAVYNVAVDLIYAGGGETPNDPAYFSAHFSDITATKAKRAIAELIDMGKLYLIGGMLHQPRAENEAKTRQELSELRAEFGRRGGISSGKSRAKSGAHPNEINDITEAYASSKTEAEKIREDKKERETKVSLPRQRGNPKTRTTPDARISEQMRAVAVARGLSDAEAEAQFAKFRDRALAKGEAYADWNAAWRNWLASPYYAPVLGAVLPLKPEQSHGRPSRADASLDAFLRGAAG
jgi:hypothetical protein